jgi:cobalt-zinc-cadmium resistance protein CzcA
MPPGIVRRLLARPALWMLLYGALIVYGVYALLQIPVEVLPRFDYPQIMVIAHYPGATPEEMETLVARPIEGEMLSLQDLALLRSVMGQGTLEIDARFVSGSNAQLDLQAVYGAIDRARSALPSGVQPYAEIMGNAVNEVADYCVSVPPEVPLWEVQKAVEADVLPALRAIPGVQRVEVFGSGNEALWVQPNLDAVHRYGVSLAAIAEAVGSQLVLGPAGYLVLGHQDVPAEARHLPTLADALRSIPVTAGDERIPLGDLARVERAAVPIHYAALFDGRPTVALIVLKQPGASTLPVTAAVAQTLGDLEDQLPVGVTWERVYSQGHMVRLIRNDLGRNLLVGGALAILVLFWILGLQRGVWVLALSIPLALLMGIAGLYAAGQTLNLLTLGALSVAVGLLADDGIIVLESIYHRLEQAGDVLEGVWQGLEDIAAPDLTGTLTTVAVFLPLLVVGGLAALFFVPFALAMSISLLASLAISLSLIPLLVARLGIRPRPRPSSGTRFLAWLERHNERLLGLSLRHPRTALALSVALLAISAVVLLKMSVSFLPLPNEGVLLDSFSLPPGSALTQVEEAVADITARLRSDPAVAHTFSRIGSASTTAYTERSFAGETQVVLSPGYSAASLDSIANHLLSVGRTDGVQQSVNTPTLERVGESLSGLPQPFVITVFGSNVETLRAVSEQVVSRLARVPSLSDVFNNDAYPVTHLRIAPREAALAVYGVSPQALYEQLALGMQGRVLARVPEGNYHVDLYMRLTDATELDVDRLERLPIRTRGGWTPLGLLADVGFVVGPNQVRHLNGARAVDILATPRGSLGGAVSAASKELAGLKLPRGYRIAFGGLYPTLEHLALLLGLAIVGAFLLLLGILVVQFEGLRVPGVLLIDMPLALTGGALALGISGVGLNATGLIGFLTLIGVSLNHDIVLLHRARKSEAAGKEPEEAVREAVKVRFRPIILTTLAAALGMLPTALGWGLGAEPEQGLAIVVLGGVIWSSVLSTNVIPALYLHWHGAWRREPGGREA